MEQGILPYRKGGQGKHIEMATATEDTSKARRLGASPVKPLSTNENKSIGEAAKTGNGEEAHDMRSRKQKIAEKIQLSALYWCIFLAGWNDGTTGPLLPRIQEFYHVGFTIVSMIFIFACLGFVLGAFANIHLTDRLGFGKTIILGSVFQITAYALQSPAPPFPVFVMAYTINGFGLALQDAQCNGFVASLQHNAAGKMGLLHAAYGAGALTAPLTATQFAQLQRWSFHYLVSLGIAILNTIFLSTVIGFKTQDECLAKIGQEAGEKGTSEHSSFKQILRTRAVHYLAFFILVYVGVEVTVGGWIVTFMRDVRGGGPPSGYVSSGFFGGIVVSVVGIEMALGNLLPLGLMLGRVLLLWVNKKVGERRALFGYALLAIAFELVVWLVPSLVGGAVAVSFVGLLLGPMYPIAMNQAGRVLPNWLLTGSIGWIAGIGTAGSAALPFLTGAISSKHGIKSLQPLLIAMMGLMMFLWYLVPSKRLD